MTTDPTPRTAATAREVCAHPRAEDGICGHTEGWRGHHSEGIVGGIHPFIALAAAEAPARVAALEAMVPYADYGIEQMAVVLGDTSPAVVEARRRQAALAAPAPTPSEPVARCPDAETIGCGHVHGNAEEP